MITMTYPNTFLYEIGHNIGQQQNDEIFIFKHTVAQHIVRLNRNIRIVVGDDHRAILVINWTNFTIFVSCKNDKKQREIRDICKEKLETKKL